LYLGELGAITNQNVLKLVFHKHDITSVKMFYYDHTLHSLFTWTKIWLLPNLTNFL